MLRKNVSLPGFMILTALCIMAVDQALPQNGSSTAGSAVLNGLIQIRYQHRQEKTDGFDVRRARLSLSGSLGSRLSYKFQNEFGGPDQKLLDAVLILKVTAFAAVHAGQFRIPFSYENLMSGGNLLSANRSLVVESLCARGRDALGNHNGRDVGVMLHLQNRYLDLSAGLFNGSGINRADLNKDKDVIGRLVLLPVRSLGIGCSYYTGRMTTEDGTRSVERSRMGAEISWRAAGAAVSAEYIRGIDDVTEKAGWYTQAAYRIQGSPLSVLLKYDVFDPDLARMNTTESVITFGCMTALDKSSRIQFNYELKSEDVEISNNAVIVQIQHCFQRN